MRRPAFLFDRLGARRNLVQQASQNADVEALIERGFVHQVGNIAAAKPTA